MQKRRTSPPGLSADAWLVRRQFGRIADPEPLAPFKAAERIGAAAGRALRKFGIPAADSAALEIERIWASVVGPDVARRATPGGIERGVLSVRVRGSAWLAEVRREANVSILPRLREALERDGRPCPVRSVRVMPDTEGFRP